MIIKASYSDGSTILFSFQPENALDELLIEYRLIVDRKIFYRGHGSGAMLQYIISILWPLRQAPGYDGVTLSWSEVLHALIGDKDVYRRSDVEASHYTSFVPELCTHTDSYYSNNPAFGIKLHTDDEIMFYLAHRNVRYSNVPDQLSSFAATVGALQRLDKIDMFLTDCDNDVNL